MFCWLALATAVSVELWTLWSRYLDRRLLHSFFRDRGEREFYLTMRDGVNRTFNRRLLKVALWLGAAFFGLFFVVGISGVLSHGSDSPVYEHLFSVHTLVNSTALFGAFTIALLMAPDLMAALSVRRARHFGWPAVWRFFQWRFFLFLFAMITLLLYADAALPFAIHAHGRIVESLLIPVYRPQVQRALAAVAELPPSAFVGEKPPARNFDSLLETETLKMFDQLGEGLSSPGGLTEFLPHLADLLVGALLLILSLYIIAPLLMQQPWRGLIYFGVFGATAATEALIRRIVGALPYLRPGSVSMLLTVLFLLLSNTVLFNALEDTLSAWCGRSTKRSAPTVDTTDRD